jgi:hypothetical protein
VWVTFAVDRTGGFAAAITGGRHSSVMHLEDRFGDRFHSDAALLTEGARFGGHANLARRAGLSSVSSVARERAPRSLVHAENVRATISSFRKWLEPFRGVSTCYLENYVAWYALLRRTERGQRMDALVQWPIPSPVPPQFLQTQRNEHWGLRHRLDAVGPPRAQ